MSIFRSLVLGVIQGFTEFLPISSSAHLIVFRSLSGWEEMPLVFDTTLHLATALSLIVCFWNDLKVITSSFFKDVFSSHSIKLKEYSSNSLLGLKIIVGSIPVGLAGFFFGDLIEAKYRNLLLVSFFLITGSILMYLGEKKFEKRLFIKDDISLRKSFDVGLFQVLSLFPGVSRSGSTISGGMIFGLNRKEATRFSFLLSIPIVVIAGVFQLLHSYRLLSLINPLCLLVGFVSSFLVGILCIKFLLKFVQTNNLYPFIIYRLILAGVILLVLV
ncbi:undecaprenyl-diphosphatase UppP [candidate division WWE3 bacterium]|uniref:Undecaprenyl-diphosphatase n=1 Tax=candidate division WWE3 bacterium TaxID=2053526 RepID=A0A7X9HTH5_UNCKA|nr:undecaprenyl-diphosphatase UppP [candidate division WWE3 bacterium]